MKKIKKELNNKDNLQKKPINKLVKPVLQKTENKDSSFLQDTGDVGVIIVDGILDDSKHSNLGDYNLNDSNSNDSSAGDSSSDSGSSGCSSSCGGGCGGGGD